MIQSLSDTALLLSRSVELSLVAKATIILIVGLAVTRLSRTARASVRHLVIASSFAALIALPLWLAGAPSMTIDVPVVVSAPSVANTIAAPEAGASVAPAAAPSRTSALPFTVAGALRAVWITGVVIFLIPVFSVLWKLSTIRRTGLPVASASAPANSRELRRDEWCRDAIARLAAQRGVRAPVELLEHEGVPGPMTFGITRPVIVLPLDAREWDEAELRRALTHELEHIKRGDWLMQILARVVAAGYWFHPLVWTAWRRLCLEAERSCDDAVVTSEERTDYAEQLVTLAQRMSATPVQPMLGMANRSDLSTRVTAVLDERLHRGRAGFALAAGTVAAAALVVIAVAPVRAVVKDEIRETAMAEPADEQFSRPVPPGQRRARALDREIYEAAEAGDFAGVKEMLEAGANANARIDGDGSPLIGAARSGNIQIAQLLLDNGADPNMPVPGDGSPLIMAAATGRLDQVALLIQRGADVNLAVEGDENPLMGAAEGGHLAVVKYLVDHGANIHTRIWSRRGGRPDEGEWRTAISQARKNRHMGVVQYLESLGAREQ
jgi:beta-lactamase regulating signal transducer with metallopeptidase domain